ncbi:hypothetical protein HWV62_31067 [Athelia sp. TMB]|nr:hypothetical protein HWV62_31067 [Athelia sp. TMB]
MVYKLVKYFKPYPNNDNPYLTGRDVLTVFTCAGLILFIATFVVGIRCLMDFDKGLLDAKNHDLVDINIPLV